MIDLPANPVDGQEVTFDDRTWVWRAGVGGGAIGAWDMKPVSSGDANLAAQFASEAHQSALDAAQSVVDGGAIVQAATTQADLAQDAREGAETARDTTVVTSRLRATTAAALADVTIANGEGFIYALADGTLQAATKNNPASFTNIGVPFPSQATMYAWRSNIANGVSLNTLVKQGVYFGNASAGYTDLPPGWNVALTFYVLVNDISAINGRFKLQEFRQFEDPLEVWTRRLDTVGGGTTTWVRGSKVADASIVTAKINAKAVTRAKLSDSYSDSGTISAATDLNAVVVTGNYLVAGAVVNGPTGAEVSGFLEVTVHGLFILQIYRNLSNPSVGWSRYIRPGTSFYGAWTPLSTVAGLPFAGQNWVFFGDSITENGDYPARVATRLGLTAYKQGYGGCRMGKHIAGGSGPLYTKMSAFNLARYINIDDYSELITAANDLFTATGDDNRTQANALAALDWNTITGTMWAFGTNDFGLSDGGLPVGTTSDVTEDTFCGAMYLVITRMQTAYPALKIGFIGPLWRGRQEVGDGKDSDLVPNPNGFYLIDYQNAMIAMGKKFHVPVYDAYSRSGFNAMTDATLLADQLHPSAPTGYQRHADNISADMSATF